MTDIECKLLLSFKDRFGIATLSDLDNFLLKLAEAEMDVISQLHQYKEDLESTDDFEYHAGSVQDEYAYGAYQLLREVMDER